MEVTTRIEFQWLERSDTLSAVQVVTTQDGELISYGGRVRIEEGGCGWAVAVHRCDIPEGGDVLKATHFHIREAIACIAHGFVHQGDDDPRGPKEMARILVEHLIMTTVRATYYVEGPVLIASVPAEQLRQMFVPEHLH